MKIINVCGKSITFFARAHNNKIIANLEKDFYKAIAMYSEDGPSICQLHFALEKVCKEIYSVMAHYHLKEEDLQHLLDIKLFARSYTEEIVMVKCPERFFDPHGTNISAC